MAQGDTQTLNLPPPAGGISDKEPLAALQYPYCEINENYNLDDSIPTLRLGDINFTADTVSTPVGMAVYGGQVSSAQFFRVINSAATGSLQFQEITTGVPVLVLDLGGVTSATKVATLYFNKYLFFCGDGSLLPAALGPQVYTGAAWGASTLTWPVNFNPFGGNNYNHRAYFIGLNSATYAYTEIDAFAASATHLVDLSTIQTLKGNIFGIKSVVYYRDYKQENVQAFFFDSGEILLYTGSYPDGADWAQAGQYIIPRPLSYDCFIECRDDTYIITESALVSVREIFTKGTAPGPGGILENSISTPIATRWKQIIAALGPTLTNYSVQGAYDKTKNRLVVLFPFYVDRDTGAINTRKGMRLIYSFISGAWWEHVFVLPADTVAQRMAFFQTNLYYQLTGYPTPGSSGRCATIKVEGGTGVGRYTDGILQLGYDFHLRTAPFPISKTGINRIVAAEVIMSSDLYVRTNFKMIGDLGAQSSADQDTQGDTTGLVTKCMVNAGLAKVTYAQLDISGTTNEASMVGQSIDGLNLWYESGGLR